MGRRRDAVILLVDHQVGPLWELEHVTTRRRVVELTRAATRAGIPIVITASGLDEHGPVIPELVDACGDAPIMSREDYTPWNDREVRRAIVTSGAQTLIIAGSDTDASVVPCALSAIRDGYDVHVALDACGPSTSRAVVQLLDAGVSVLTTPRIVTEFRTDSARLVAV